MTLKEFILARFAPNSTSKVEFVEDATKTGELLKIFHDRGIDSRVFRFQFFRVVGFYPGGAPVSSYQCSIQFGDKVHTSDVSLWKDGYVLGNELIGMVNGTVGDPMVAPE